MTFTIQSHSVEQTVELGSVIGRAARPNLVVGLEGVLGAGKTYLVKGIAQGLGVRDLRVVNSPTYVIVNEYEGRLHLFHVDVYRLKAASELETLGFDEMCRSGGLVVVEWADRVKELIPPEHLWITLEVLDMQERRISLWGFGESAEVVIQEVEAEYGCTQGTKSD